VFYFIFNASICRDLLRICAAIAVASYSHSTVPSRPFIHLLLCVVCWQFCGIFALFSGCFYDFRTVLLLVFGFHNFSAVVSAAGVEEE
jgi:hypothetical protein